MNKLDVRAKRVTDNLANIFEKNISYIRNERKKKNRGITLIALVLTVIVRYVKNEKYSNNNSFLLMNS